MWAMLVILVLLGFELVIVGLAFQRHWLVLVVPGLVCGGEAWSLWRRLTGRISDDPSSQREPQAMSLRHKRRGSPIPVHRDWGP